MAATPWLIQEGAPGTHVLNIWNMSVSGTRENYGLTYAESVIVPKQPDLLFVSYGHNDGEGTVRFRWGVQSLVETVAAGSPRTEILLVAQNPETGNTFQQAHAAELAQLASEEHLARTRRYPRRVRGDRQFFGVCQRWDPPDPGRFIPVDEHGPRHLAVCR